MTPLFERSALDLAAGDPPARAVRDGGGANALDRVPRATSTAEPRVRTTRAARREDPRVARERPSAPGAHRSASPRTPRARFGSRPCSAACSDTSRRRERSPKLGSTARTRVAPRHSRTLGRPWLVTPAAMFNLAGTPVTEIPLGLCERGLPLGVQIAAARDHDHVSIAVALELERVFGGWVAPAD